MESPAARVWPFGLKATLPTELPSDRVAAFFPLAVFHSPTPPTSAQGR
jgi:hypothetical protein